MSMTTTNNEEIRPITPADDAQVAALIRKCLKAADLDKPGTVYFDTGLDSMPPSPIANTLLQNARVKFLAVLVLRNMIPLTRWLNSRSFMSMASFKAMG